MAEYTPAAEIESRCERYRALLQQYLPECEGALVFSRLNLYYFTGTLATGVLWLPIEGDSLLFCRKGVERAKIESPLKDILPFNSYKDIRGAFEDFSIPLPSKIAAEMNGLPWSLSKSLLKHLAGVEFVSGDKLIAMVRAVKSEWELQILSEAGKRHDQCLTRLLPPCLHGGMSELEISHKISELSFSLGHNGILRMDAFGEETFLGHIAIGQSANYPSFFNGPVGLRGTHPAAPFMGSAEVRWEPGSPLTIDCGFMLDGYQTDKTQVYWLGDKGSIPKDIQRAHDFCLEIQAQVAGRLKPGVKPSELWKQCEEEASQSPWSAGFMGLGNNKVNFVGHGIGLAIDEYPVIANGFDLPLEEGMVLAIEPKVGLPGVGMVGIENTFEVTRDGGMAITGEEYDIITI